MTDVVIVAALRTATGSFRGAFADIRASELSARVLAALLERSGITPADVDDVILGQVLTAGQGQNPARQAALAAGLPETVPAMTVNRLCGSGLDAVALARQIILAGDARTIIAGGQENMSAAMHALPGSRDGQRLGDWKLLDTLLVDGLHCALEACHMGETAENVATRFGITREAQDAFALESQRRAQAAIEAGRFADEIVPITLTPRRGEPRTVDRDEHPRPGGDAAAYAKLRPAFAEGGTVTAANASGLNDGAAALLITTREHADALGLPVLATIMASSRVGVDPAIMGTGPIPAVRRCLERARWHLKDVDLIESNEAFAAQSLAVLEELGLDPERVNVNGGAIALGHPIGASGARILVTLVHELRRRDASRGIATLCVGGGQGVALAIERDTADTLADVIEGDFRHDADSEPVAEAPEAVPVTAA